MLMPVDMRDWLPPDHLVWFVVETVDALDCTLLEQTRRRGGAGAPGYDPRMLFALLVYAYSQGVRSSREIERRCVTDVAFRVLCAQGGPDHTTIARFRTVSGRAFVDLFTQVLMVAARAGLGRFGTVAIDGTKIPANASIDANRGAEWFRHYVGEVVAEVVAESERVDAEQDASEKAADDELRADRVPIELRDRTRRVERIRAAASELATAQQRLTRADRERAAGAAERLTRSQAGLPVVGRIPEGPHRLAEAQAHLARESTAHQAKIDRYAALVAAGCKPMGRPPVPMEASSRVQRAKRVVEAAEAAAAVQAERSLASSRERKPLPNVVANTTDPQSRIMPTRKGFLQGYNVQVAVTGDQLIVAVDVGQATNDQASFVPMMQAAMASADRMHAITGHEDHVIGIVLADAGYDSDRNVTAPGPDRLIASGKSRDHARALSESPAQGPPPGGASPRQAMAHRLRTPEGHRQYKRRGATVEPGIANLKKLIDRFSARGLAHAGSEIHLAATAFNLRKIHHATAY